MVNVQSVITSVKEKFWDEGSMCYYACRYYDDDMEKLSDSIEDALNDLGVKYTLREYTIPDPVEDFEVYIIVVAWINECGEIEIEQITTY